MMDENEAFWLSVAVLIGVSSLVAPDGYGLALVIIGLIIGCNITGMLLERHLNRKEIRRDDMD